MAPAISWYVYVCDWSIQQLIIPQTFWQLAIEIISTTMRLEIIMASLIRPHPQENPNPGGHTYVINIYFLAALGADQLIKVKGQLPDLRGQLTGRSVYEYCTYCHVHRPQESDVVKAENSYGWTPLICAIQSKDIEKVKLLLLHGGGMYVCMLIASTEPPA